MRLAAIAAVLLVLTCAAWVAMEVRKDARAEKQCIVLRETVEGLNALVEKIAVLVERAEDSSCCRSEDAAEIRARKVRRPTC